MAGGMTAAAPSMSSEVGARLVAPGMAMIFPIVLTNDDELTTSVRASAASVKSQITSLTSGAATLLASTRTPERGREPGLVFEAIDVGHGLAALIDPPDRIGLDLGPALDGHTDAEQGHGQHHHWRSDLGRKRAEAHHDALDDGVRSGLGASGPLSDTEDRGGEDDAGDDQHDDPDGQHHAEVADHGHLRDAQREEGERAGDGGDDQRRAEVRQRLGHGVLLVVEDHLLLDPVVDLDGEVDAQTDEDGEPGDGDQRQVDADVAEQRERPDHADDDAGERQQPPAHAEHDEQDDGHHHEGGGAQGEHAALQVVVDVAEEDRRAGRGDLEAVEVGGVDDVDAPVRCRR